ncbi:MAG: HAD family hydrolase [Firmicutes bacterium]|nr:HAD family hydrolase [Bacillota bacterium]MDH7495685.1 HAD family hydrolase [Bacillota bacterium]
MIRAILFDLDGTLVHYDFDAFVREYLAALGARLAHMVDPARLARQIMKSTEAMVRNLDPCKTNRDVFAEDFFPAIGIPEDVLSALFDDFYRRDFPKIGPRLGIRPHPSARRMVETLLSRGLDVIIATNPVFPLVAIEERMRWGGLYGIPYKLVTSYETMHFCKPNPEYYVEILQLIHRMPDECLMVGNDVEEDIVAGTLGMTTYLVEDFLLDRGRPYNHPDFRGTFDELVRFLERGSF